MILLRLYIFRHSLGSQQTDRKVQRCPIYLFPHTQIAFHTIKLTHQSRTFVNTDEPPLTHCNYLKSMIHTAIHFWYCIFDGFRQMCNNIYHTHHYGTMPNTFNAIKIFFVYLSLLAQLLTTFTVSIILTFPEYHVVGIILSFSTMHLKFLHDSP